jgi:hypothetical protein
MILALKKLLFGSSKKSPKANDTATTSTIDNTIATVKTASDSSVFLVLKPIFFKSFFGDFQKKSFSLFKLIELSHHQFFKTTSLDALVLKFYFVVLPIRDRGGHGSSIIRKNGDYDSFQAFRLLYINNND